MKALRHLLVAIFSLLSVAGAYAQYSFSITLKGGGIKGCSQAVSIAQSQMGSIPASGFRTKSECDQARNLILAIKVSAGGCNVSYTCTPCTGTDISNGVSSSAMNGTSSNNPVLNQGVEVRNNYEDYKYMRQIQDRHNDLAYVIGGNSEYGNSLTDIVNQDIGISKFSPKLRSMIQNIDSKISKSANGIIALFESGYGSDLYIIELLDKNFFEFTGVNIDNYLNRDNLSYDQQEILNAYLEYCDYTLRQAETLILTDSKYDFPILEMAYYAHHVYSDDDAMQYNEFCKPLSDVSIIKNPGERAIAQSIVDYLKTINGSDGFDADFYYDESKDKYILAFRGTETTLEDWLNDTEYLSTGRSAQHDLAAKLADFISQSGLPIDKLSITGHSLGGGLAYLAGLKTGAITYGYNPLNINTRAVEYYKLDISNTSNIHEIRENSEMLIRLGEATITTNSNTVNPVARAGGAIIKPSKEQTQNVPIKFDNVQIIDCGKAVYNINGLHHRIGDLVKGIEHNYATESTNFHAGKVRLSELNRMRKEIPNASKSSIKIDASGLQLFNIK